MAVTESEKMENVEIFQRNGSLCQLFSVTHTLKATSPLIYGNYFSFYILSIVTTFLSWVCVFFTIKCKFRPSSKHMFTLNIHANKLYIAEY